MLEASAHFITAAARMISAMDANLGESAMRDDIVKLVELGCALASLAVRQ